MINLRKENGIAVKSGNESLVLSCTDTPLHHWVLTSNGFEARFNVNQFDFEPAILVRGNLIFFGVEQGIFALDMITNRAISAISDASSVQWIEEDAQKCVVFAAEDEVITLDNYGNLLWRKNLPDVIEMTNIVDEKVLVTDMSGEEYELNLKDGSSV
jgi:hypothetical protein